jgi:hypothetical protein
MAATPEQARAALTVVTTAAKQEAAAVVAAAGESPTAIRSALFVAAPLIVTEYASGSAALALDWFEDLREAASPPTIFRPSPVRLVTDDNIGELVALATQSLFDVEKGIRDDIETALAESLSEIESRIQKRVASAFRDAITQNTAADPSAVGWRRYARPGACRFCLMLAGKGEVYTESTANFAAHGDCHCVAGQSYDPSAPRASAMQYVASKKRRSAKERAAVRAYLNENYPDARG